MGIDPLTHKPLSIVEKEDEEPLKKLQNNTVPFQETMERPLENNIKNISRLEESLDDDQFMEINLEYGVEDVPLIETESLDLICSNSTMSSSTSTSSHSSNDSSFLKDLQFPEFEWSDYGNSNNDNNNGVDNIIENNMMSLWEISDFSSLDLLLNDESSSTFGLF